MNRHKNIHCFFTQVQGHGGIPRFNRNLIQVLSGSANIYSLNDSNTLNAVAGYNRKKFHFLLAFIQSVFQKPSTIVLGHINFLPFAFIAWLFKIKVVVILHGVEAWSLNKKQRFLAGFVNQFWAVSQYTKEKFHEESDVVKRKIFKIFNTLPQDWNVEGFERDYQKYFLSIARLSQEESYKGILESIEAIAEAKDYLEENDWKYIVVAHGDDVTKHEQLVSKLRLQNIIEFQKAVPDEELKKMYAACSFFLLPSSGEGFGIVFLEAMSFKKPCIGAIACGSSDVIVNGNTGFLVNRSPQEIKEAILKMTNDEKLIRELGSNGFDYLQSNFTFEHFDKRINELIRESE